MTEIIMRWANGIISDTISPCQPFDTNHTAGKHYVPILASFLARL